VRVLLSGAVTCLFAMPLLAQDAAVLKVEFSNPNIVPSHWTLTLHPDGSGHFHAERGSGPPADGLETMEPTTVNRDIQLSQAFTDRVFETVRHHKFMDVTCESHLKVAFQGWKKITYTGPDGQGSCEFNYSKDRDIENLGEWLVGVANTITEGARLQMVLLHDPLGLDKEMQYLLEASGDGRLQQVCAISGILQRVEDDPEVMDRVRKRARILLEQANK